MCQQKKKKLCASQSKKESKVAMLESETTQIEEEQWASERLLIAKADIIDIGMLKRDKTTN